jgi:hypothetical protein
MFWGQVLLKTNISRMAPGKFVPEEPFIYPWRG